MLFCRCLVLTITLCYCGAAFHVATDKLSSKSLKGINMISRTKVVLIKCGSYDFQEILPAVERLFTALGGIQTFVRAGQTVLLKPNLLSSHRPDEAVTTHPEVVRALIRLVKQAGATPIVADSGASAINIESIWEKTGFRALCAEEAVPLLNLEKAGSRHFDFNGIPFSIAKPVLEADVVISVPKLKTHVLTVITNAVKNMYGTIPGYQKTMLHKQFHDPVSFGRFLASLYAIVKPSLTVSDAIIAMEGNGPSNGNPVHYGFLAASSDGVALDTLVCHWLKINPRRVPYFSFLKESGAGETQWQAIDVAGDSPSQFPFRPMKLPSVFIGKTAPAWLYHWLGPLLWIRPLMNERCTACGLCVRSCPVSALTLIKGKPPVLIPHQCIQCCCCHEVCPAGAVILQQSLLMRLVHHPSRLKEWITRLLRSTR